MATDPLESFAEREHSRSRAGKVDRAAGTVLKAFDDAGVEALVVKGPAIAEWLYDERDPRGYGDLDLLVAPGALGPAGVILASVGLSLRHDHTADADRWEGHEQLWRGREATVDLHWRLPGIGAPPEAAWSLLWEAREHFEVADRPAARLAAAARALHLATHAAQHGANVATVVEDLRRGLSRLPRELWSEAAQLAVELDAVDAFATGLRVLEPEGVAMAERLGLPPASLHWTLMASRSTPLGAMSVLRLREARGVRARLRIALRAAFPPRELMGAIDPRVRAGRRRLLGAYSRHFAMLPVRAAQAARAVRAARRGG